MEIYVGYVYANANGGGCLISAGMIVTDAGTSCRILLYSPCLLLVSPVPLKYDIAILICCNDRSRERYNNREISTFLLK